ncbi:MAG: FtsX-like permease family protein [Treponemataceae bacterium]
MNARFFLGLAFRNLTRHKRRTILTATSMAAGLAMFILFDSLLTGLQNDGVRSMVWYDTGALQVQNAAYWDEKDSMPLDKAIERPDKVLALLDSKALKAAPRAVFQGELVVNQDPWPESGSARVRVVAIDPTRDGQVFRLKDTVAEGKWLSEDSGGIVLGYQLAKDLGAKIGYPLTVVARTKDGAYQTMDLRVSGIVNTPNAAVNRLNAYISLEIADEILYLGGSVNQIVVAYDEDAVTDAFVSRLGSDLSQAESGLSVLPWKTTGADFLAFVQSRSGLSRVLLFIVFIIAAVGVSNTMLMTILERTREMGMLRAQGMYDKELTASLQLEAAAIGLIGGVLGLVLSLPLNAFLVNTGFDLSWMIEKVGVDLPMAGRLRGAWHPRIMFTAVAAGAFLSFLVSVVPVRRAVKMSVVEALRHN